MEYKDGVKDTSSIINQLSDVSKDKLDGIPWYKLEDNEILREHNKRYMDYNVEMK